MLLNLFPENKFIRMILQSLCNGKGVKTITRRRKIVNLTLLVAAMISFLEATYITATKSVFVGKTVTTSLITNYCYNYTGNSGGDTAVLLGATIFLLILIGVIYNIDF